MKDNFIKNLKYELRKNLIYFFIVIIVVISLILTYSKKDFEKDIKNKYEEGYIDACNDFYNGKLKYELIEYSNGTREWRKIQ